MNYLGIDYGAKRVGVAFAPSGISFASPLCVIENKGDDFVIDEIKKIIDQENIDALVIGVPYTLKSGNSEQTNAVLKFVNILSKETSIPLYQEDERMTSRMAHGYEQQGADKSLHDALAAMSILQLYLDKNN